MKKILMILLAAVALNTTAQARKVTGKVVSGGEKLSGVIVTDGTSFTQTKKNGKFSFDIKDDAEFVYIVTPAGYAADWSTGVPAFYQSAEGKDNFVFDLLKTDNSGDYSIIAVSDPQTKTKKHFSQFAAEPMAELCEAAADLEGAVAGIILGDICWDSLELLEDYKAEIVRTGIPFYPVVGNHDHELEAEGDIQTTAKYRAIMGPENYAFFLGKDVVIALDNIIYETQKKYEEGYAPHVLAFVQGLEQLIPEDAHIYVVQHGTTYRWFEKERWVVATKEFLDILKDRKVSFISGHTHIANNMIYGENVVEHNVAAICASWWDTYYCTDGTPSGYKVFTCKDGELEWYYKSLGKDKDYQVEFFMPGETPHHAECVVANVWDWDPEWKVEWYQDGKYMGVLDPTFDLSPNYIADINRAFEGKTIPNYKKPRHNWHYFAAKPGKDAKTVKVVVRSRFGQQWECEVDMTKYADGQFENIWPEQIPENAVQILKDSGIF